MPRSWATHSESGDKLNEAGRPYEDEDGRHDDRTTPHVVHTPAPSLSGDSIDGSLAATAPGPVENDTTGAATRTARATIRGWATARCIAGDVARNAVRATIARNSGDVLWSDVGRPSKCLGATHE